jgi:hypothetical protein
MTKLEVEIDDLLLIRYNILKGYKDAVFTLAMLENLKTRHLTQMEKLTLPESLKFLEDEDLVEQINPWISLVDNYANLIEQINRLLG